MVVSKIFYVHPYLGKISNLTDIFQMGWNHQPVHLLVYKSDVGFFCTTTNLGKTQLPFMSWAVDVSSVGNSKVWWASCSVTLSAPMISGAFISFGFKGIHRMLPPHSYIWILVGQAKQKGHIRLSMYIYIYIDPFTRSWYCVSFGFRNKFCASRVEKHDSFEWSFDITTVATQHGLTRQLWSKRCAFTSQDMRSD